MGFEEQAGMERVPILPGDWTGPGNAVTWGGHSMLYAVENKHANVAFWLYERADLGLAIDHEEDDEAGRIIHAALATGFFEMAAKIMTRDRENPDEWMLEYSLDCPVPNCIEMMLENGYFEHFERAGLRTVRSLARRGNLELLQRVVQVYEPLPTESFSWKYDWLSGLVDTCKNGHLPVIKFMMEHLLAHEAFKLNPQK